MLAARHQAKPEFRFVKDNVCADQKKKSDQHKPAKFKFSEAHDKRLFRLSVCNRRRYVVRAFRHIDRTDKDDRYRRGKQIHRRPDQGLIGVEFDRRHAQKQRKDHSQYHACQNIKHNYYKCG